MPKDCLSKGGCSPRPAQERLQLVFGSVGNLSVSFAGGNKTGVL